MRPVVVRGRRTRVLAGLALLAVLLPVPLASAPAGATLPAGDTSESDPAPTWGWEPLFFDGFDGPAGEAPAQWHQMPGWDLAVQNGQGQLDVGHLAQIRSTSGWALPAGTQVRVTASLLMPDTGTNYTALWVQHPDPADPREIDVVESYGPLKPTGVQLGSHLCYDETLDDGVDECAAAGRAPELFPVTQSFVPGALPWEAFWQYSAAFTVGGEQVVYDAQDGSGNAAYTVASTPDARRVPGNALPFHLRLSNKDVDPEYAVPGGVRSSMLVDWVSVEVKYPDPADPEVPPILDPATPVPPSEVPVS
ncbi:hypothetical protein [Nocardioides zeicaulis]|uniref:GH16 domain-containing protein n=1 Tax=Nocardioides zeicaulis TaxID=1776857 RepID=A0ABV6E0Q9_9ACTN